MSQAKPLNIVCAGECMVELKQAVGPEANALGENNRVYLSKFAGDVTNFAIYLKRLTISSRVQFLSATGDDLLSDQMREFLSSENINLDLLAQSEDKTLGLYMIQTDDSGERSFTYWRSDSAAKRMFDLSDEATLSSALAQADYFYFSGITLAILDQASRERLFSLAEQCRDQGKSVVFDPNFRPGLWPEPGEAQAQIGRAYQLCNLLLSSCEDEQLLWGEPDNAGVIRRLSEFGIEETVLTDGPGNISICHKGELQTIASAKVDNIVDTTSAGDSFNAGYLAARHLGASPAESAQKASALACVVIGLPGAIIPQEKMPSF